MKSRVECNNGSKCLRNTVSLEESQGESKDYLCIYWKQDLELGKVLERMQAAKRWSPWKIRQSGTWVSRWLPQWVRWWHQRAWVKKQQKKYWAKGKIRKARGRTAWKKQWTARRISIPPPRPVVWGLWKACRDNSIYRGWARLALEQCEGNTQRRDWEYREFCWWWTMNSRGHSEIVSEIGERSEKDSK